MMNSAAMTTKLIPIHLEEGPIKITEASVTTQINEAKDVDSDDNRANYNGGDVSGCQLLESSPAIQLFLSATQKELGADNGRHRQLSEANFSLIHCLNKVTEERDELARISEHRRETVSELRKSLSKSAADLSLMHARLEMIESERDRLKKEVSSLRDALREGLVDNEEPEFEDRARPSKGSFGIGFLSGLANNRKTRIVNEDGWINPSETGDESSFFPKDQSFLRQAKDSFNGNNDQRNSGGFTGLGEGLKKGLRDDNESQTVVSCGMSGDPQSSVIGKGVRGLWQKLAYGDKSDSGSIISTTAEQPQEEMTEMKEMKVVKTNGNKLGGGISPLHPRGLIAEEAGQVAPDPSGLEEISVKAEKDEDCFEVLPNKKFRHRHNEKNLKSGFAFFGGISTSQSNKKEKSSFIANRRSTKRDVDDFLSSLSEMIEDDDTCEDI
uniref:Uncharacterized protein n=1 Tax=Trieres chinensis TaxID=1514140 RepID=A0A7S2EYX3_TRICV|mmetsp:Transcript_9409/g.19921  ORF Transcript_9409/g.19921 Transcript_9409/m.19921 type:complete len:440 (+) Transcript_9409:107-1426(+)